MRTLADRHGKTPLVVAAGICRLHLPEGPPGSDLERLRDFGHLVKEPGLLGLLEEGIQLAFP